MDHMSDKEKQEFLQYCKNASKQELQNILKQEHKACQEHTPSAYYLERYHIAMQVSRQSK